MLTMHGHILGQNEPDSIDPEELIQYADDEIFVRSAFKQDFSEQQGYVNEFIDPDTLHQYFISQGTASDLLMAIFPSQKTVRTTNKRLTFDQSRKEEFHVSFSVERVENIPANSGGKCWIRFSNMILMGKGRESGLIIYPGDKAYYFTHVDGDMVYETVADLSTVSTEKMIKFDFIRLAKTTYVYADGVYLFSFYDEIKESVSFEGGAELLIGGNRVRCDFDNFSMRTK